MRDTRINSFFSGAGLFEKGLQQAGLEIQQSFEIDKACCNTMKKNFSHDIVRMDITQKLVQEELECDVMVITFPCNRYSRASDILGNRTGDELFLHAFRHIAIAQPEMYIVENVPGMKKFPIVMEAMTQLPNYHLSEFCPVYTSKWLPQKRDRLILFGTKKPFSFREDYPDNPVTLKDVVEKDVEMDIPNYFYNRLSGSYRDLPIKCDPDGISGDLIAPTCVAHYSKDLSTRVVVDKSYKGGYRPFTVREYARLQGVPDDFEFAGGDSNKYRQIGNGVPVPIGRWVGNEINRYFGG